MEHDQLIEEMNQIERLTTAERLRLARKRRGQQLKKWAQREREYNLRKKAAGGNSEQEAASGHNRIHFVPAIMLLEAAARNDVEEVRRLLQLGVSPDSTNEDGLTALHQCCIDDSEEMMKVLVEFGGNVNAADSEQWTPLHAAATCGHLHLVKFLIEAGANLLAVNGDGNMPYDICEDETTLSFIENEMAKRGVTQELIDTTRAETETRMLHDLAQLVADKGDLEFRDKHGATPLHIAAANGYLQVLEFLLDHHVSTEVFDLDLWQPLHAAACWGHLEAVEILAQNGADISAVTRSGETPFDITEDPDIKERLVELAEQRLRMADPGRGGSGVRRGRSSAGSTRTHSIRRTSLRDKMKTTKKDVAEEGLIYMKSVTQSPSPPVTSGDTAAESSQNNRNSNNNNNNNIISSKEELLDSSVSGLAAVATMSGSTPSSPFINQTGGQHGLTESSDVVDLADVQISLAGSYPPTPSATIVMSDKKANRPVQHVAPIMVKSKPTVAAVGVSNRKVSPPPVRPARLVDRRQSSVEESFGGGQAATTVWASSSSPNVTSSSNSSEPINIHVSVTINPPPVLVAGSSYASPPGTLADLKRTRSQNRVAGSVTSSTVSLASHSPEESGGVSARPQEQLVNQHPSSPSRRKKFAANSSVEVVGPPVKSGCCRIF